MIQVVAALKSLILQLPAAPPPVDLFGVMVTVTVAPDPTIKPRCFPVCRTLSPSPALVHPGTPHFKMNPVLSRLTDIPV